jgi:hypothetical protein
MNRHPDWNHRSRRGRRRFPSRPVRPNRPRWNLRFLSRLCRHRPKGHRHRFPARGRSRHFPGRNHLARSIRRNLDRSHCPAPTHSNRHWRLNRHWHSNPDRCHCRAPTHSNRRWRPNPSQVPRTRRHRCHFQMSHHWNPPTHFRHCFLVIRYRCPPTRFLCQSCRSLAILTRCPGQCPMKIRHRSQAIRCRCPSPSSRNRNTRRPGNRHRAQR